MNCYIRSVEVIDRNLPDLAPLFDEMRDRLRDEHGITRARYYHAVPVADGARLAVSASPPIRALAEDYVRNRRHEIDHLLLERMRLAEPTGLGSANAGTKTALAADARTRQAWASLVRETIGEGLVARLRRCRLRPGRTARPVQDQRAARAAARRRYMARVRHVLQDFHLAYCQVQLAAAPRIRLAPGDQEALAGVAAGLKADAIGYELGITGRAVEERLARARKIARLQDHRRGRRQGGDAGADPLACRDFPSDVEFPRLADQPKLFHSPSEICS